MGTFVKLQIHYDFNCVKQVPGTGKTEVIIYESKKVNEKWNIDGQNI